MDTGIQKSKYPWVVASWSIKIKVKGDNIVTMYNMVPYNSNVMNVEDDITNIFTIRQKRNVYHREDNKCGDNFIMIILDESH